jgi:hypothetical protein
MKLIDVEHVRYFPSGRLQLSQDGAEFYVTIDEKFAASAAKEVLERGDILEFSTQAEIIAFAVNTYKWRLGNKYKAVAVR